MLVPLITTRLATLAWQAAPPNLGMTPEQQIALESVRNRGAMNDLTGIMVPLAFFATIAVIIWLLIRQKQARMAARAELQKHLLDKFSSGREFAEFLEGSGGRRFLEELSSQSRGPKDHVLSALRNGIVLAVLGLGMLGLSFARHGFLVPAVLVLALGVGFLISTAVARRMSRPSNENQSSGSENAPIS